MILGAHISTAGGVEKAPPGAKALGCRAVQIFAKNQNQWVGKPLSEKNIAGWKSGLLEHGIDPMHTTVHDSYLINLCAPDPENRLKSIRAFIDELERCEVLGIPYLVSHPGSHLKQGEEWGLIEMVHSLDEVHAALPGYKTLTLLETTAGQGTNLGYKFEHIAFIREQVKEPERIGVCLDTCHTYSAGYDTATKYEEVMSEFDRIIGLSNLKAFHLNDSKKPFASRVDRHEDIGYGSLGLEPFRHLVNDPRFQYHPGILETPEGEAGYEKNLMVLRSLIDPAIGVTQ
ncbi:MAG: deoxyribonuclease IV [bacterium]|nr:deoxyribonuclease IV [bacterium]